MTTLYTQLSYCSNRFTIRIAFRRFGAVAVADANHNCCTNLQSNVDDKRIETKYYKKDNEKMRESDQTEAGE